MNIYDFELEKQKYRTSLLKSLNFYNKIDSLYELLDRLSQKNFQFIKFLNKEKGIICPSYGMNSSLYTLKGIKCLCEIGDIIDAFTLVRKIRDNLYLDLFFISESLNNNPESYEFSKSFEEMTQDEMVNELYKYVSCALTQEQDNINIQNIKHWFDNDYCSGNRPSNNENFFSYKSYKNNIEKKYKMIKKCHSNYLDSLFKKLNKTLNNYVHSNGPSFISNDSILHNKERFPNSIKDLLSYLDLVKRLFIIDLYFIDARLFETDDYEDAVEMGMQPKDNSQYDAIYQIVEEFKTIDVENHDLYIFLKEHNHYSMKCFYDELTD